MTSPSGIIIRGGVAMQPHAQAMVLLVMSAKYGAAVDRAKLGNAIGFL